MSSIFDSLGIDPGIIIILLLILTIVLAVNVFSSKMRLSRLERTTALVGFGTTAYADDDVLEFYHGYYQDESEWAAA